MTDDNNTTPAPDTETASYGYDARGNVATAIDGQGFRTDFAYNAADQLIQAIEPATGQTGCDRTTETLTYAYPGGSLLSTLLADEATPPNVTRQVADTLGSEGEATRIVASSPQTGGLYDGIDPIEGLTYWGGVTTV